MASASALRIEIERSLENRFPAALTPAPKSYREVAATGVATVDTLLDGGFPVGAISEVTGPTSSGRTSLTLAFLTKRTETGQVCAWVDVADAFDPESAAASGVQLKQLLWVRCGENTTLDQSMKPANTPVWKAKSKPWTRLDQALRAVDLLLQAGGFAAIVLDLGATDPKDAMRIPLATWFRFRQAADRTRCSLVVLGKAAYAQSSAAVMLECSAGRIEKTGNTLMQPCTFEVRRGRQRFTQQITSIRKPPASTWSASAAWETGRHA